MNMGRPPFQKIICGVEKREGQRDQILLFTRQLTRDKGLELLKKSLEGSKGGGKS